MRQFKRNLLITKTATRFFKENEKIKNYNQSLIKNQINFFIPFMISQNHDFFKNVIKLNELSMSELLQVRKDIPNIKNSISLYFRYGIKKDDQIREMLQFLPEIKYTLSFGTAIYCETKNDKVQDAVKELINSNDELKRKEGSNLLFLMRNTEQQYKEVHKVLRMLKYLKREIQRIIDTMD